MEHDSDLLIVGAGPVGLFSVFQAGMLGISCCVVDSLEEIGGQCIALYPDKPIYDIPAYPIVTAESLIKHLAMQAAPFKPKYILGQTATTIVEQGPHLYVETNTGTSIRCKAIIVAAGSGKFGPNRPPLEGISEYENKTLFYFVKRASNFQGKKVMIAGGGDSAVDWAVELSEVVEKLYVIHRRMAFRCLPSTLNTLKGLSDTGKVEMLVPYQLAGLNGSDGILTHVVVKNISTREERVIETDFLLPFFGLSADLGPILNWELNIKNFRIPVDYATMSTRRDRIYAVGDIADYPGKLKLILTGFAEASMACHSIYHCVFPNTPLNFQYSTTKGIPTKN